MHIKHYSQHFIFSNKLKEIHLTLIASNALKKNIPDEEKMYICYTCLYVCLTVRLLTAYLHQEKTKNEKSKTHTVYIDRTKYNLARSN